MKKTHMTRWVACVVMLVLLLCLGTFLYLQKAREPDTKGFYSYIERIKIWAIERKNRLHRDLDDAKQLVSSKKDDDTPVHFEFYTVLPNVQIAAVDSMAVPEKKIVKERPIVDENELERELAKEISSSKKRRISS